MPAKIDLSTMNPKQQLFFKARKRFVGYGGARGGGKSWSVQRKASILALYYPGIKILILRRTYRDLERNHVRDMTPLLESIAEYSKSDKLFTFPNGSIIELGYCAAESDAQQYQGIEYDVIFFDEATQFTETQFSMIYPSVRGTNNFPKRVYITCNPGGVGHEWVKRLFITKRYNEGEDPDEYEFIPATVDDNAILKENDPDYIKMLNSLPDGLRQAWRDGNWDMLAGQYFSEFDRKVHVIEPFAIPEHWKKFRAIDYGLDCLACVWVAVDERGYFYVYREYAESDKIISQGANDLLALSEGEKIDYTYAPPDLMSRSKESGKSIADIFDENGLYLDKSNNNREAGWLAIKDLLSIHGDEIKDCRLKIFSSCPNLIEHLTALQRDAKHPTDCMTEPHEITHLPDALRYFAVQYISPSRPAKPKKTELQKIKEQAFRQNRRFY